MSRLQTLRDLVNKADQGALIVQELTVDAKSYALMVLEVFDKEPEYTHVYCDDKFIYSGGTYNTVTIRKGKK